MVRQISRYDVIDGYTLGELQREYKDSEPRARIRLLRKLYGTPNRGAPPFEIALMAVEDANVSVRQWIARHGRFLDYREMKRVEGQTVYEFPERNLEERLKNDPDPLVRAALRENRGVFASFLVFSEAWERHFREATHLERLALVRNPGVDDDLIQKVFDYHDEKLGIDLDARKELVLAYLSNTESVKRSRRLETKYFPDGFAHYSTNKHFSTLWKLISKWPKGTGNLQWAVYSCVGTDDTTKAEVYQGCDELLWRHTILEDCKPNEVETLKLGMKDSDDTCREIAYTKASHLDIAEELESVIRGKDKSALHGLARNVSLPQDIHNRAYGRWYALADFGEREVDYLESWPLAGEEGDLPHEVKADLGGEVEEVEESLAEAGGDPTIEDMQTVMRRLATIEKRLQSIDTRLQGFIGGIEHILNEARGIFRACVPCICVLCLFLFALKIGPRLVPSVPAWAWLCAAGVLFLGYLIVREVLLDLVRNVREWWRSKEELRQWKALDKEAYKRKKGERRRALQEAIGALIGLVVLLLAFVYGLGWLLGYFPSPKLLLSGTR